MSKKVETAKGLIGVSLAIGAIGEASNYYAGDALYLPRLASEFVSNRECPDISTSIQNVIVEFPLEESSESNRDMHQLAKESAERNGLTLKDETQYLEKIDGTESTDEVLDILNEYVSESNFFFALPEAYSLRDIPYKMEFFEGDLELDEFRSNVKNLIEKLYYIPVEVLKKTNINSVKIVKKVYKDSGLESIVSDKTVNGKYSHITDMVYVQADSISTTTIHEIGHDLDYKVCGIFGAGNDPIFNQHNPIDFEYGIRDEESLDVTQTLYGQTNIMEDKADIIQYLALPYLDQSFEDLSPVLQKKLVLLINRIDHLAPGYFNYWLSISGVSNEDLNS